MNRLVKKDIYHFANFEDTGVQLRVGRRKDLGPNGPKCSTIISLDPLQTRCERMHVWRCFLQYVSSTHVWILLNQAVQGQWQTHSYYKLLPLLVIMKSKSDIIVLEAYCIRTGICFVLQPRTIASILANCMIPVIADIMAYKSCRTLYVSPCNIPTSHSQHIVLGWTC